MAKDDDIWGSDDWLDDKPKKKRSYKKKDEYSDFDAWLGEEKPPSKKQMQREISTTSMRELKEAHSQVKQGAKDADKYLKTCQSAAHRALKYAHAQDALADAIVDLQELTSRNEKPPEFPDNIAGLDPRSVEQFAYSQMMQPQQQGQVMYGNPIASPVMTPSEALGNLLNRPQQAAAQPAYQPMAPAGGTAMPRVRL